MRITILSLGILGLFCFGAPRIFAQCSCEPKLTLAEEFQRAEVVFIGKVIEAKKTPREPSDSYDVVVIKFEVKQTWKRDLERFVVVKELFGSPEGFDTDAEWLLFALKDGDGTLRIVRECCSRTLPVADAIKQGYVKGFKKMRAKPQKIHWADARVLIKNGK